jgi:hypothetical protein
MFKALIKVGRKKIRAKRQRHFTLIYKCLCFLFCFFGCSFQSYVLKVSVLVMVGSQDLEVIEKLANGKWSRNLWY